MGAKKSQESSKCFKGLPHATHWPGGRRVKRPCSWAPWFCGHQDGSEDPFLGLTALCRGQASCRASLVRDTLVSMASVLGSWGLEAEAEKQKT